MLGVLLPDTSVGRFFLQLDTGRCTTGEVSSLASVCGLSLRLILSRLVRIAVGLSVFDPPEPLLFAVCFSNVHEFLSESRRLFLRNPGDVQLLWPAKEISVHEATQLGDRKRTRRCHFGGILFGRVDGNYCVHNLFVPVGVFRVDKGLDCHNKCTITSFNLTV